MPGAAITNNTIAFSTAPFVVRGFVVRSTLVDKSQSFIK